MIRSCAAIRRRLAEFHDGELSLDEQVAVHNHLAACTTCAAEARAYAVIGSALRASATQHSLAMDGRELGALADGVVSRFKAERDESLSATFQRMFEDLHLVWAALGATAATLACLVLTIGVFYLSRAERPDSLAGFMASLSNSGSNAYPVKMDTTIAVPRQEENDALPLPDVANDEVWVVNATITREGRVADLQLIEPADVQPNWNTVGKVLDTAAMARFEPARSGGSPVAVTNMVWMLAHLTVRPKAPGEGRAAPPPVKLRGAIA